MDSRGFPAKTKSAFLLALRNALVPDPPDQDEIATGAEALMVLGLVQRYVRDTVKAFKVKAWYEYRCQLDCDPLRLPGRDLDYVEGAHIQPLGDGHKGPDTEENLLSLCPNHHVLFDYGAIYIDADYRAQWSPDTGTCQDF
jgi:predicted restriction endonuclease